ESRERADFAFDETGAFIDKTSELGIERFSRFGLGAPLQVTDKTLRRKLYWCERILNFVRDAARNFLPRGRLLREQELGEIVHDEDVAGVGAARAERADGDSRMENAAADDHFHFA